MNRSGAAAAPIHAPKVGTRDENRVKMTRTLHLQNILRKKFNVIFNAFTVDFVVKKNNNYLFKYFNLKRLQQVCAKLSPAD